MHALTPIDRQDLRHAVLAIVYDRPAAPLAPSSILASAKRLVPAQLSLADIEDAIRFHCDLGNLKKLVDEWGSEDLYEITAAGRIAHERLNKAG